MSLEWYEFPAPITFLVNGKDSPRYLHNRLTVDIKGLPLGQSRIAAALTPQGKTECLFRVFRIEEYSFLLSCDGPRELSEQIKSALARFIVADRVTINDVSEQYRLRHILQEQEAAAGALKIKLNRLGQIGTDILGSDAPPLGVQLSSEDFELRRVRDGLPAFPQEVNIEHLFAEFEIPDSISFTKGCYVGQEVMERIDSRGKAPRAIKRLCIDQSLTLSTGTHVLAQDRSTIIAQVLTSVVDKQAAKTYAFVSVKRAVTDTAVLVENIPGALKDLF